MPGTTVVAHVQNLPAALPDFLQGDAVAAQVDKFNAAAMGGIKTGGFPRLSISGSKFFILDNSAENPRQLITVKDPSGQVDVPSMVLSVVIAGSNPNISKLYYEGAYVPGDDKEPDCSSDDGVRPDAHVANPPSTACATCPMNAWGSKITPQGKEAKACADGKRLVIIPAGDLRYKALALNITPAMLKDWGAYVRSLSGRKIPVNAVVTRLMFDPTVDFPKLNFAFERFLTKQEYDLVLERAESDEIKNIEKPVRAPITPQLAAPSAVQTPVIPPAPAHLAPASAPATASFAAPVSSPAPVVVAPPPPPPTPVDPLAGIPPELVAAINQVGGVTTAAGVMLLQAARAASAGGTGDSIAAQAAAAVANQAGEAPKRRGRPPKTAEAPPTAAPVTAPPVDGTTFQASAAASQPTPEPAQPAPQPTTGFATSPAAVVVPPGSGVASQLDDLLGQIMGGAK